MAMHCCRRESLAIEDASWLALQAGCRRQRRRRWTCRSPQARLVRCHKRVVPLLMSATRCAEHGNRLDCELRLMRQQGWVTFDAWYTDRERGGSPFGVRGVGGGGAASTLAATEHWAPLPAVTRQLRRAGRHASPGSHQAAGKALLSVLPFVSVLEVADPAAICRCP